MSENKFDVVVIGSGPGGYVAAIRAAQLGLKTACVEKDPALGGTCLNVGCIPSKALLQVSEEYVHAGKVLARHGVMIEGLSLDLDVMMGHKDKVVGDLTKGIAHLFKNSEITSFAGTGALGANGEVIVSAADGSETKLEAGATIIATGSAAASLPGIEIDEKRIVSSTGGAGAGCGTEPSRGNRRGVYRLGDGLRLGPPRRQDHGDRISRPHRARHGRRIGGAVSENAAAPENEIQTLDQSDRRRSERRRA